MQYEFELFDKIIYQLSRPFSTDNTSLDFYVEFLNQKHSSVFNLIVANFKKDKNGLTLKNKKTICSLHPSIEKIDRYELTLFQSNLSEIMDKKALASLQINPDDIIYSTFDKDHSGNKIYIKVKCSYDTLNKNEARYYYYNFLLKEEVHRIKKSITTQVFLLRSSQETELYIHKMQQALINLTLKISKNFKDEKVPNADKLTDEFNDDDILYLVYNSLEDLLRYFENTHLNYIDKNIQIPCRSALVKKYDIEEKLSVVKSALLDSQIDVELLNVIYKPFLELSVINDKERITYKELIYSNTFLTAFYDELVPENEKFNAAQIIDLLYRYNFNSLELFNYKTTKIKEQISQYSQIAAKIDFLYHCIKTVSQRQCKQHLAYNSDLPSLKVHLINWLEEEINYLNKKLTLEKRKSEEKVKLHSGLSVPQLAYFYKLIVEVGIITHDKPSDVFKFVSENFQTEAAKDISVISIKNKFYNVEESTLNTLRAFTIKILNKLNEE